MIFIKIYYVVVISLSLDSDLMNRFDEVWDIEGFQNRSEAMRSAIRDFIHTYGIQSFQESENVEIRVVYSYHDTKAIRHRLESVEHEHEEFIIEKQHKHISGDLCFDMLTIHGIKNELSSLIGRMRAIKGIESLHTIVLPLEHKH